MKIRPPLHVSKFKAPIETGEQTTWSNLKLVHILMNWKSLKQTQELLHACRAHTFSVTSYCPGANMYVTIPRVKMTKYYWVSFRKATSWNWLSTAYSGFPKRLRKPWVSFGFSRPRFLQGFLSEILVRKIAFRRCFWVSRKAINFAHCCHSFDIPQDMVAL